MSKQIQPVRGMNDVLPAEIGAWQHLERVARGVFEAYGYEEVRVPIVEHTELFKRSIGEYTDIVEKEMYTFEDIGGDSLTLRPEATAGIARAAISNGLLRGARHKLWCSGSDVPARAAAEGPLPAVLPDRCRGAGLRRPGHRCGADRADRAAVARAQAHARAADDQLAGHAGVARRSTASSWWSISARTRARSMRTAAGACDGNPLRILDSKNPRDARADRGRAAADRLTWIAESQAHFAALRAALDAMGIAYEVNPRLVRGLDYYSRTVFEWVTDALGAQDAVCSGGRYDGLIAQLGGEPTPAIGFADGRRARAWR